MTEVHRLSRREARRIAVRAQLLAGDRPTDLVTMVDHLTALPVDMTAAVAAAPDLVAWGRMGAAYEPADLHDALAGRDLYDDGNAIRPMADLPLHLAEMEAWPPWESTRDWLEANELFRNEVLDALDADGPMLSRERPRDRSGAVEVERVERRPQRADDAGMPARPRRGRDQRP